MNPTAPAGCAAHRYEQYSATHNICSSDMHLVVILLTLGCSRDLSFIFDLKEKVHKSTSVYLKFKQTITMLQGIIYGNIYVDMCMNSPYM